MGSAEGAHLPGGLPSGVRAGAPRHQLVTDSTNSTDSATPPSRRVAQRLAPRRSVSVMTTDLITGVP